MRNINSTVLVSATFFLFNIVSSWAVILVNKLLFREGFKFVCFLTTLHQLATAGAGHFPSLLRRPKRPDPDLSPSASVALSVADKLLYAFLLDASVVGMNFSLMLNTVGTYQLIKFTILPCVAIFEAIVYRSDLSLTRIASMSIIFMGSSLVVLDDSLTFSTSFSGIFAGVIGIVATASQTVLLKHLQQKYASTSSSILSQLSLHCAGLLFIFGPLADMKLSDVGFMEYVTSISFLIKQVFSSRQASLVLFSCMTAACVNLSQYLIIGRFSALAFQVLGQLKMVGTVTGGVILFGEELSMRKGCGMFMAIVGTWMFARYKSTSHAASAKMTWRRVLWRTRTHVFFCLCTVPYLLWSLGSGLRGADQPVPWLSHVQLKAGEQSENLSRIRCWGDMQDKKQKGCVLTHVSLSDQKFLVRTRTASVSDCVSSGVTFSMGRGRSTDDLRSKIVDSGQLLFCRSWPESDEYIKLVREPLYVRIGLQVRFVHSSPPSTLHIPGTTVALQRHAAGNAGHFVFETALQAVAAAQISGSNLDDLTFLFLDEAADSGPDGSKRFGQDEYDHDVCFDYDVNVCKRLTKEFTAVLTNRVPIFSLELSSHVVHFDRLVAASEGLINGVTNHQSTMYMASVRNLAYKNLDISTDRRPRCDILVNVKVPGRHGKSVLNGEEFYTGLKLHFDSHYPGYHVCKIKLDDFSVAQQISILSDAEIYISPPGSGLFMSAFLRDDAYVLTFPSYGAQEDSKPPLHSADKIRRQKLRYMGHEIEWLQWLPYVSVHVINLKSSAFKLGYSSVYGEYFVDYVLTAEDIVPEICRLTHIPCAY